MTTFASPTIVGLGASSVVAAAVAGMRHGSSAPTLTGLPGGARVVLLAKDIELLMEGDYWGPPCSAWIETLDDDEAHLAALVDRAAGLDFFYSFSAQAAMGLPLAGLVTAHISRLSPGLSGEHLQDLELALHEAVSNALVHGNLGVGSMRSLSIDALEEYSRSMMRSLADPALAHRRVEVSGALFSGGVEVTVLDEGAGYQTPLVKGEGACGRGLDLIAGVAEKCDVSDGGRKLTMRFQL